MSDLGESDHLAAISVDDGLAAVDTSGNVTTEKRLMIRAEEPLPEDAPAAVEDSRFVVERREKLEPDNRLAKELLHYAGRERRKNLDQQIELLYDHVARDLNDNPTDVAFALKKLREAQGIVLEDMGQYEEALYLVALVKKMLVHKRNLKRWSYTWGMFVFFYALLWLIIFIAGFFIDITAWIANGTHVWFSALSGGIGGVVAMLYHLYWHVSIKQAFDRQYVIEYLLQPFMGLMLGAVIFFITSAGFFLFYEAPALETGEYLGGVQAFQMLLGFVAGFRQQVVYNLIDQIVQRLSSRRKTYADNPELAQQREQGYNEKAINQDK